MGQNAGAAAITALVSFAATNIDDFLVLVVFFAQVNGQDFTYWHVILGQILGFTAIVTISLLGIVLGLFIPNGYIGFLGLVPLCIGVKKLCDVIRLHCGACSATVQSDTSVQIAAPPARTGEIPDLQS